MGIPESNGRLDNEPTLCVNLYAPKDLDPFAPNSASISENDNELPDDLIVIMY